MLSLIWPHFVEEVGIDTCRSHIGLNCINKSYKQKISTSSYKHLDASVHTGHKHALVRMRKKKNLEASALRLLGIHANTASLQTEAGPINSTIRREKVGERQKDVWSSLSQHENYKNASSCIFRKSWIHESLQQQTRSPHKQPPLWCVQSSDRTKRKFGILAL